MSRLTSLLLALGVAGAATLGSSQAHAAACGNDHLEGSEACDVTQYAGYAGTPSCADVCGSGTVGVVSCTSTCTINCAGCHTPDSGVPADAGIPTDASSADSGTPSAGTCRSYSSTPTYFEAGSLIIPMDTDCQGLRAGNKAFGLAWHLLRHGIPISWALDTTKSATDAADFTVTGSSSPVVLRLERGSTAAYDNFTNSFKDPKCAPSTTHSYGGAPMIIAASDADAALQLIYQGTLPDNPAVAFGWGLDPACNPLDSLCFVEVEIHRAQVGFTAPVSRTTSTIPTPIALLQDQDPADKTDLWLSGQVLNAIGLDFPGAGGTASSPGLIYDELTQADVTSGTVLVPSRYQMLWMNGDASRDITSSAVYTTIADFVGKGRALLASGDAILALECNTCASNDCSVAGGCAPVTQFQGTTGIVAGKSSTAAPAPNPGSLFTQVDDMEYAGFAEEVPAFEPLTTWKPCTFAAAVEGKGVPLFTVRDDASMGQVFYVAGRNYNPGAATDASKIAMQRTVINLLFLATDTTQTEQPLTYELTRATPLVLDAEDSSEHITVQGTYDWPDPSTGRYYNSASVSSFRFPLTTGHIRAYNISDLASDVSSFGSTSSVWNVDPLWAGTGRIPSTGCTRLGSTGCSSRSDCTWSGSICTPNAGRNVYTATGNTTLTRQAVTIANATNVQSLFGLPGSMTATGLIHAVRSAPLGGIDQSSPALAVNTTNVKFPSGATRDAALFVGSLDGMLHAFTAKDVVAGTGSFGNELWAFVLPDQLAGLWQNNVGVQGSPSVVDVYGDFLGANGKAGQDGTKEWITLLTISAGQYGRAIYALDVSQPSMASTAPCPDRAGSTGCEKGPNPLWVVNRSTSADTADIGGTRKAALGLIHYGGALVPVVVALTNIGNATGGQGGVRLYVIKATDGSLLYKKSIDYTCTLPNGLLEPNDVPARVILVDRDGDKGFQSHAYFGDLQGRVWELDLSDSANNPVLRWDSNDRFAASSGKCNYPIAAPMSMYRNNGGQLNLVLSTGGIWWANSNSTTPQKVMVLTHIDAATTASAQPYTVIYTMSPGERLYGAPVIVNEDIYFQTSSALVDQLSGWTSAGAVGTIYTSSVASGTPVAATSLGVATVTGASLSVGDDGRVVSASMRGIASVTKANASDTSTRPQADDSGSTVSQLRLWLPNLRN